MAGGPDAGRGSGCVPARRPQGPPGEPSGGSPTGGSPRTVRLVCFWIPRGARGTRGDAPAHPGAAREHSLPGLAAEPLRAPGHRRDRGPGGLAGTVRRPGRSGRDGQDVVLAAVLRARALAGPGEAALLQDPRLEQVQAARDFVAELRRGGRRRRLRRDEEADGPGRAAMAVRAQPQFLVRDSSTNSISTSEATTTTAVAGAVSACVTVQPGPGDVSRTTG